MTYKCDPCDGAKPVQILLTNLGDGSTDAACMDDLPIMLIGHLAIQLDVDPQRLYDTIQKWTVREAAREAKLLEAAQATTTVNGGEVGKHTAAGDYDDREGADPDDVAAYPERYGLVP